MAPAIGSLAIVVEKPRRDRPDEGITVFYDGYCSYCGSSERGENLLTRYNTMILAVVIVKFF